MAEVDTVMLSQEHSDIRREAAEHRATITQEAMKGFDRVNADVLRTGHEGVKETLKANWNGVDATKDARYDLATRIGATDKNLSDQSTAYFISNQQYQFDAARDVAALKATTDMGLMRISSDILTQGALGQAATALESAKVAAAIALGQSQLSKEIFADGQKTRDLVNDLKYHDLNRSLIERNTELVEERHGRRHWRHAADNNQYQGQWAALQNQVQAFQSQLQETRQGMVNFGTMAGVGQTSSSNAVR